MIMQAYDFVELYRRYGCRLQSSGSDQWGNIVSGIDLGRRVENVQLFGLTTPLITTASGAKMGKTAAGAVWLNADMRSPYDYWQFWRNTEDADVGRFLRLFTDLPRSEIARLEDASGRRAERREERCWPQKRPQSLTAARRRKKQPKPHGARSKKAPSPKVFPTFEIARASLAEGMPIANLAQLSGLTSSSGEARRFIQGGGLRVNDAVVSDVKASVGLADITPEGVIKLSVGRKKHILIKPV